MVQRELQVELSEAFGIGSAFQGSAGRYEHMRTALFLVNASKVGLWESACGVVFACLDDH